jgi:hypothetical protein
MSIILDNSKKAVIMTKRGGFFQDYHKFPEIITVKAARAATKGNTLGDRAFRVRITIELLEEIK